MMTWQETFVCRTDTHEGFSFVLFSHPVAFITRARAQAKGNGCTDECTSDLVDECTVILCELDVHFDDCLKGQWGDH
jgi:hypothetical protein